MKRSVAREIAVQLCYSYFNNCLPVDELLNNFLNEDYYSTLAGEDEIYGEYPDKKQEQFIRKLIGLVSENYIDIDRIINQYSNNWKAERLSGTSLNILRCAICEMLHMEDVPVSVSINEAVELAKKYDSEEASAFINGILGSVSREIENSNQDAPKDSGIAE